MFRLHIHFAMINNSLQQFVLKQACVVCASVALSPCSRCWQWQFFCTSLLKKNICKSTMLRTVGKITSEVEGMSRKINKQFGLLPLIIVWEIVDSPSMLIPSNPAPVELLMATLDMVTLTVCRKYKVLLGM